MVVERWLELQFGPNLVQQPVICEMSRACDVVFNVLHATIAGRKGLVRLSIAGEEDEVDRAEQFLRDTGVAIVSRHQRSMSEPLPAVPRCHATGQSQEIVERKVWLTAEGDVVGKPVLWEMSRRFDVTFDIRQSSVGRDIAIVAVLLKGSKDQVEAACRFLQEKGLEVEPIEKTVLEL